MIIREGENCWVKTRADRATFLIDAADYFEAFALVAQQARQTIYIVGWDFDSRLVLDRRGKLPFSVAPIGDFLNHLARSNRHLHIYVLTWDYHLVFLHERQLLPKIQFGWTSHRRIHFHLDDQHPVGGSHHQKFVVIDDAIAFCGGLDLTSNRWDTSAHRPADPRRTDWLTGYMPFHDVQLAVSGEPAQALGNLFRLRWHRSVGKQAVIPSDSPRTQWPAALCTDSQDCHVGVARTAPSYKIQESVREIEGLYIDAIGAADHSIYIENQYLTSETICRHLARRLSQAQGPEIAIVMPSRANGWLEQSTMDAIRRHNLEMLFKHDHDRRLAIYWPSVGKVPVYVHSKILIADDRLAIVGSANLSNRSMGFDSECCLAVEGESGSRTAEAIALFRNRLVAEHLGRSVQTVADACRREGSLLRVIETLGRSDRCLTPLDPKIVPVVDGTAWIPDPSFLDPAEPFAFDQVMDGIALDSKPLARTVQLVKVAAMIFGLLSIAAVWRWTPLADWLTLERLIQWAGLLDNPILLMVVVIAGFVVGGLVFFPVTLLIGATAIILPTWQSFLCALSGCVLSAWATYWVGRRLGRKTVRRLTGNRLNRLNKYLARQGVLATMLLRNLPIAPFSVVNIMAGTTQIKQAQFLLGTALGMLPGIMAITIFTGRVMQVVRQPSLANILTMAAIAAIVGFGLWWMRRRLNNSIS